MHKLKNGSQVAERPARKETAGTAGYFSESNDAGSPSYPGQDWFNGVIDEFLNALAAAGVAYDSSKLTNLADVMVAFRNASNLNAGTVPDNRLPVDLVRNGVEDQEFGDGLWCNGPKFFFGADKEHQLFDNTYGNAGIKFGCDGYQMTLDGGAVEFEAAIDNSSVPWWAINLSVGSQGIGDSVAWSASSLKGSANGELTWGGKKVVVNAELTGSVHIFATQTTPLGFIKCNGAVLSRTSYADLFEKVGTTFGEGDGETTFQIPDLRGEFIRVCDDARGIDVDREFGSYQSAEVEEHKHLSPHVDDNTLGHPWGYEERTHNADVSGTSGNLSAADVSIYTSPYGGTETRPRNIALAAYIKY